MQNQKLRLVSVFGISALLFAACSQHGLVAGGEQRTERCAKRGCIASRPIGGGRGEGRDVGR